MKGKNSGHLWTDDRKIRFRKRMKEVWSSPELRAKMRQVHLGTKKPWVKGNYENCVKKCNERIEQEIPELERQGFKCVPITRVIPDIVAFKDGKIYAIEVEYSGPDYAKYDKIPGRYDDVIWILRKRLK